MRRGLVAALATGLLAGALGPATPAAAEVRRLEVVGAAPAGADAPRNRPLRDAALDSAIAEGVERVARELLGGAAPESLREGLGDPREYAVRYRILEDRGERRALLLPVPVEYVVLVEVHVDATRVQRRLAREGLLAGGPVERRRFRLLLEEVSSYGLYQQVRQALEASGARRAVPLEIRPGRMLLDVEADAGPERVMERLVGRGRGLGLEVRVLEIDRSGARVRASRRAGFAPGGDR